jgi:hypothetical protein
MAKITPTEEEWVEQFKPVIPLGYEGELRPLGEEPAEDCFVQAMKPRHVWKLLVSSDEGRRIVAGFWPNQGQGFYVTLVPWAEGNQYVVELET